MKLVYENSGRDVRIGDVVRLRDGEELTVQGIIEPHKPSSTGRVYVVDGDGNGREYFPGVIDAVWIDREDQRADAAVLHYVQEGLGE